MNSCPFCQRLFDYEPVPIEGFNTATGCRKCARILNEALSRMRGEEAQGSDNS